jgi:UDP-N-acetylmuramate dehydrogenase
MDFPMSSDLLRGTLEAKAPLAGFSWFRTGGAAQWLFTPDDEEDLATCLVALPPEIPVWVIGLGSNLLVRDGGVEGVVIRLGKGFSHTHIENGTQLVAGAGVADVKLARLAAEQMLDGFAFLRGIPGSIGGLLRMNGGAYGGEAADILIEAQALDRSGRRHVFRRDEMGFSYRHCAVPEEMIFTRAVFQGREGDKETIQAQMNAITQARGTSQPVNTRTGGSTFRNPEGARAWELIDKAGCRGLRRGAAQVSELHCNFLINHGGASAADIEDLGEGVRRRVLETSGILLEWEIKRIGHR